MHTKGTLISSSIGSISSHHLQTNESAQKSSRKEILCRSVRVPLRVCAALVNGNHRLCTVFCAVGQCYSSSSSS